jgi:hypothetical protein
MPTRWRWAPTWRRCRSCGWRSRTGPVGPATRGVIERGAIGLLSRRVNPLADAPSPGWLGLHALAPEVRTSGLWNVNQVDEPYDPAFLDVLEGHLAEVERAAR